MTAQIVIGPYLRSCPYQRGAGFYCQWWYYREVQLCCCGVCWTLLSCRLCPAIEALPSSISVSRGLCSARVSLCISLFASVMSTMCKQVFIIMPFFRFSYVVAVACACTHAHARTTNNTWLRVRTYASRVLNFKNVVSYIQRFHIYSFRSTIDQTERDRYRERKSVTRHCCSFVIYCQRHDVSQSLIDVISCVTSLLTSAGDKISVFTNTNDQHYCYHHNYYYKDYY